MTYEDKLKMMERKVREYSDALETLQSEMDDVYQEIYQIDLTRLHEAVRHTNKLRDEVQGLGNQITGDEDVDDDMAMIVENNLPDVDDVDVRDFDHETIAQRYDDNEIIIYNLKQCEGFLDFMRNRKDP